MYVSMNYKHINRELLVLDHWHKTMDEVGSSNTNHVVDSYVHFVTSRYPRFRYKCGWDSILIWCPMSCFPTNWIRFMWAPRNKFSPAAITKKKYD